MKDVVFTHSVSSFGYPAPQASLQCRREIAGAFYLFTFQAVSFCDFGELDVRISEITIEVLAGLVKYRR
jgi:hypothetical protein